MTLVFVATHGRYSNYRVDAIFSTRAKAKEFIYEASKDDYDAADITEWTLDGEQDKKWRALWLCHLDAESGDVVEEHTSEMIESCTARTVPAWNNIYFKGHRGLSQDERAIEAHGASYVSSSHARKLAAEVRQAWLRAGKPIERYSWAPAEEKT